MLFSYSLQSISTSHPSSTENTLCTEPSAKDDKMSTIPSASPRLSISSIQSSTTDATAPITANRTTARRNKAAALRDYYGLRNAQSPIPPSPSNASINLEEVHQPSALDQPDFEPKTYVSDLLAKEGVEGVVKVEAGLLSEIRTLDGEKKALVYDNYSKLISATETIRKMREKMDPLTPTTSTLTPAIGHIAESASNLADEMRKGVVGGMGVESEKGRAEKETVRWVITAPERLRGLRDNEGREEAEKEWRVVEGLLNKWSGVRGVKDVRRKCLEALESGEADTEG